MGVAGLLPVVSGVLEDKSLIINGVSFSGNGAALLVGLGFISLSDCRGWYWRNAFLSPSNRVSRFSVSFATELWLLKGSLPYPSLKAMATDRLFSGVLADKSLTVNGFLFSKTGFSFSTIEAWMACSSGDMFSVLPESPK